MNKIYVIGVGPGDPNYILPIAQQQIKSLDIVIAGERNQRHFDLTDKEVYTIKGSLEQLQDYIEKQDDNRMIGVLVSGDPGFYSMQRWLIQKFGEETIEIIPGVSSVQYFFNRLKKSHEKSYWVSLHGRDNEFLSQIKNHRYTVLLTDHQKTPQSIAKQMIEHGLVYQMYVGENLSYSEEKITKGLPKEIVDHKKFDMSVVVIENDRFKG